MILRHPVLWPQQKPRCSCSHGWVMAHMHQSRMNESCHTWMSHLTHEWVMSHMNESCHTWMSLVTHGTYASVTHEWVMSHMNESCHTWMSHVTHEWVMSHMNESCHTRSHELSTNTPYFLLWMSKGTCVSVTHEWVRSRYRELSNNSTPFLIGLFCKIVSFVGLFCKWDLSSATTQRHSWYGVATISVLLKMTGLFCKILSLL